MAFNHEHLLRKATVGPSGLLRGQRVMPKVMGVVGSEAVGWPDGDSAAQGAAIPVHVCSAFMLINHPCLSRFVFLKTSHAG
jgi:hypothetical protein